MKRSSLQMSHILKNAAKHWVYVAPLLAYPNNDADYDVLVERLDSLLDMVGEDENHPLIGLVDALSHLISAYEEEHFSITGRTGVSALIYLMELHQLNQSDLRIIGSQGVVSEILSGKRMLNLRQIITLAKFFRVDASTFIDEPSVLASARSKIKDQIKRRKSDSK